MQNISLFQCILTEKDDADRKQVLASSKDWHIDLEKESLRLVFNNEVIKSNITISSEKVYQVVVVVNNDYISFLVNGNEVKKEMKVPEKETMSIKIGNSQKMMPTCRKIRWF